MNPFSCHFLIFGYLWDVAESGLKGRGKWMFGVVLGWGENAIVAY